MDMGTPTGDVVRNCFTEKIDKHIVKATMTMAKLTWVQVSEVDHKALTWN